MFFQIKQLPKEGQGALAQWIWEETHVLMVVGLNPSTVYWMDIF